MRTYSTTVPIQPLKIIPYQAESEVQDPSVKITGVGQTREVSALRGVGPSLTISISREHVVLGNLESMR